MGPRGITHATTGNCARARIGPNALIQTVEALVEAQGRDAARRLLSRGGRGEWLTRQPETMVDETEFTALIATLRRDLGPERSASILARAGARTGRYLLAHRIPGPVRTLLPHLPRRLALRALLKAIAAHAWTFAGSGRFSWNPTPAGAILRLVDGPEARGHTALTPSCAYYRNCFETLLRSLVAGDIAVTESECMTQGAPACVFDVAWPRRQR